MAYFVQNAHFSQSGGKRMVFYVSFLVCGEGQGGSIYIMRISAHLLQKKK